MTTIASLRVALEADTRQLRKGIEQAKASVAKLGTAVAGVSVGFGAFVKSGLDGAEALFLLSQRTGASVEALSVLEHQARRSDASIDDLESALDSMNERIADASSGAETYVDAFRRLQLDTEKLVRMKPDEAFQEIAAALRNVRDETTRSLIGNTIFGDSYVRLLPLIQEGTKGYRQAARELRAFGGVLTGDAAAAAARANRSMSALRSAFGGIARTLSIEVAPKLATFLEALGKRLPGIIAALEASFSAVGTVIAGIAKAQIALLSFDNQGVLSALGNIPELTRSAYNEALDSALTRQAPAAAPSENRTSARLVRNSERQLTALDNIERAIRNSPADPPLAQ